MISREGSRESNKLEKVVIYTQPDQRDPAGVLDSWRPLVPYSHCGGEESRYVAKGVSDILGPDEAGQAKGDAKILVGRQQGDLPSIDRERVKAKVMWEVLATLQRVNLHPIKCEPDFIVVDHGLEVSSIIGAKGNIISKKQTGGVGREGGRQT